MDTNPVKEVRDNRFEYIDILRVISMLSVVFLHTAAGSLRGNIGSPLWHFSNVLTAFMSSAVPVFFMISGALLLNNKKTLSVGYTYKKRITKIFIPFLVWSLVAVAYYAAVSLKVTGSIDRQAAAKRLMNILSQPTTIHLWFMYALIPLYMLSPILKKLVDNIQGNLVKYMVGIWLVFSSILPTITSFIPKSYQSLLTLSRNSDLNFMSGYLGFFVIGYYLLNYDKRVSKKILAGIIVLDTAIISLGTWWKTLANGSYSEVFKSYSKLFMLILSISIFLMAKELLHQKQLSKRSTEAIRILSSISFGVYLVHNLVVDLVSHKVNLWPANSVLTMLIMYLLILLISVISIILPASSRLICFAFTGLTFENACRTCNIQYFSGKLKKVNGMKNIDSTVN